MKSKWHLMLTSDGERNGVGRAAGAAPECSRASAQALRGAVTLFDRAVERELKQSPGTPEVSVGVPGSLGIFGIFDSVTQG
jgi:hypothetical protein